MIKPQIFLTKGNGEGINFLMSFVDSSFRFSPVPTPACGPGFYAGAE